MTFVAEHDLDSTRMDTFAFSSDYIAIGCKECNKYFGLIDIFKINADFPLIFSHKGNSKNKHFGQQTEMLKKDKLSQILITSYSGSVIKRNHVNVITIVQDYKTGEDFYKFDEKVFTINTDDDEQGDMLISAIP